MANGPITAGQVLLHEIKFHDGVAQQQLPTFRRRLQPGVAASKWVDVVATVVTATPAINAQVTAISGNVPEYVKTLKRALAAEIEKDAVLKQAYSVLRVMQVVEGKKHATTTTPAPVSVLVVNVETVVIVIASLGVVFLFLGC